ncbi:MAG: hypothetical protein V1725_06655 [archaeon]
MALSLKDKLTAGRAVLKKKVTEAKSSADKSITVQTVLGAADGAFSALKRKVTDYSEQATDYLETKAAEGSGIAQAVLAGKQRVEAFTTDIRERYQILLNETSPLRILVPGYDDIAALLDQEQKTESEQSYTKNQDGLILRLEKTMKKGMLVNGGRLQITTEKETENFVTACNVSMNYLPRHDRDYVSLFHALAKNALTVVQDEFGMDVQQKTTTATSYAGQRSTFILVEDVQYPYKLETNFENSEFKIAYTPKGEGMTFTITGQVKA